LGITSPDNSLETAAKRIETLIFPTKAPKASETPTEKTPAPDPKTSVKTETEESQTPEETEETPDPETPETPEQSDEEDDEPAGTVPPQKFKVKVGDEELEVTEDDLKGGYLRTKDYTQKTQKLAEERKTFEEKEVAEVRKERELYATYLKQLEDVVRPAKVDWDKLRSEVPADVFAAAWADHDRATKQADAVAAERAAVDKKRSEDLNQEFGKYVEAENEKLLTAKPEWRDPVKGREGRTELVNYARKLGFSDNEIGSIVDHRVLLVLDKARQLDKQAEAKPTIQNKIDKVLVEATPGSTRTTTPQKGTKLQRAKARVAKSGSVDDAAAAIAHLID